MSVQQIIKYLWASPNTLLGVLFMPAAVLSGGRIQVVDGIIELYGPAVAWLLQQCIPLQGGAHGITFGHVIIARDKDVLARCRHHEQAHVRQYERWGPLFIPVYLIASVVAYCQGGHPYHDNHFEQEARCQEE
jgi:hypothetical protein